MTRLRRQQTPSLTGTRLPSMSRALPSRLRSGIAAWKADSSGTKRSRETCMMSTWRSVCGQGSGSLTNRLVVGSSWSTCNFVTWQSWGILPCDWLNLPPVSRNVSYVSCYFFQQTCIMKRSFSHGAWTSTADLEESMKIRNWRHSWTLALCWDQAFKRTEKAPLGA